MSTSHLTRKEIKRDEVREAMGRSVEYVRSHERTVLYVVGGAIALLLAAALVTFFLGRRADNAAERLTAALRVHGAQVDPLDPAPDDAEAPRFATESEKRQKSRALFEELVDGYGGTDAGKVAHAYLGDIAAAEGNLEEARAHWQEYLDSSPGTLLAVSVELNVLALDRAQGKLEEVAAGLQKQLDDTAARSLPEDVVLFELAKTLDELGRDAEAQESFQRLVDDHPRSPFALEARQRLQTRAS
jgi:tetratricopeptide (TPR) repeat protein